MTVSSSSPDEPNLATAWTLLSEEMLLLFERGVVLWLAGPRLASRPMVDPHAHTGLCPQSLVANFKGKILCAISHGSCSASAQTPDKLVSVQ